jgi:hypothetical protein
MLAIVLDSCLLYTFFKKRQHSNLAREAEPAFQQASIRTIGD